MAKLPPFGNNEPLPPPPPFINPNQREEGRTLTPPITTPASPPNVTMSTPPFSNNQPLPPPPPLVNPIQEQSARDLTYAASMSKQLGDNMAAAGIARPANTAAHHIVAWNAPQAELARDVLDRFGESFVGSGYEYRETDMETFMHAKSKVFRSCDATKILTIYCHK